MEDEERTHTMQHINEHSYTKPFDTDEPMDTTPSVINADVITPHIAQLDVSHDTFETLLITLLRSHSRDRLGNQDNGDSMEIAPEALDTLSSEQIHSLVTSSSVNYLVIQQILTQRSKQECPVNATVEQRLASIQKQLPNDGTSSNNLPRSPDSSYTNGQAQPMSLPLSSNLTTNAPVNVIHSGSPSKQTGISIQISPDHLKHLQAQISEMFRKQNLQLPPNLSQEQKEIVINSLIAQQLNASIQQLIPNNVNSLASINDKTMSDVSTGGVGVSTGGVSTGGGSTGGVSTGVVSIGGVSTGGVSINTTDKSKNEQEKVRIDGEGGQSNTVRKRKESETKRPPTPFNIYFSEVYPTVFEEHSSLPFSEASKIVSGMWNKLGQDGKQKYYDRYEQLKADYNTKSETTPLKDTDNITNIVKSPDSSSISKKTFLENSTRNLVKKQKEVRVKEEGMCLTDGCYNMAANIKEFGAQCCSKECIVKHSRTIFLSWVIQRKLKT